MRIREYIIYYTYYLYVLYTHIFLQITELSRIGGSDIKKMIFNLLRTLMSDKLACMFNYIGGKKKRMFYDLELRKIILSKYIIILSLLIIILIYKPNCIITSYFPYRCCTN